MFSPHQNCPHCEGAIKQEHQLVARHKDGLLSVYLHCEFCEICIFGEFEPGGSTNRLFFRLDYKKATEPQSYAKQVKVMRNLQLRRNRIAAVKIERNHRQEAIAAA